MSRTKRHFLFLALALALVAAAAIGTYVASRQRRGLPSPGTDAYEQTVRHFYRGLAGLQVGLVDAARQEFVLASGHRAREPAVWANLGLAYLRLGDFDAAAPAVERARALAPSSSQVAFLAGRLETSRGRRDEGIASLRRAVELDPRGLQVRTALIQEVENAGGPDADAEAQRLLEELFVAATGQCGSARRARAAGGETGRPRATAGFGHSPRRVRGHMAARGCRALQTCCSRRAAQGTRPMRRVRRPSCATCSRAFPSFRDSRARVTQAAELIADPFTRFGAWRRRSRPRRHRTPRSRSRASRSATPPTALWLALAVFSLDGDQRPVVLAADDRQLQRVDGPGPSLPIPTRAPRVRRRLEASCALDWNHDFKPISSTAGSNGIRLFIQSRRRKLCRRDDARVSSERSSLRRCHGRLGRRHRDGRRPRYRRRRSRGSADGPQK